MLPKNTLVIMAFPALILAIIAMSCAPAARPAITAQPAATPPAASTTTSWGESKTYTDEKYGVSFSYPKSWITTDLGSNQIYAVAASAQSGDDNGSLSVMPKSEDIAKAMKEAYEAHPGLSSYNVKMDIVSSKATTLADGKTAATEVILSARILGMYDLYGYNLAIVKGDNIVYCSSLTLGGDSKKAAAREIVQTLAVK